MKRRPLLAALFALLVLPGTAWADKPHVEAQLLTDKSALEPGGVFTAGVQLKMKKGWHTYWVNPGESGLATEIVWKLPEGFEAGPFRWPSPVRFEDGGIVNYGYTGEVMPVAEIRVPPGLKAGEDVTLAAVVKWVACNQICVPEKAELAAVLPVKKSAAGSGPETVRKFVETKKRLPRPLEHWEIVGEDHGKKIILRMRALETLPDILKGAFFFASEKNAVEYADPQEFRQEDGVNAFSLSLPVSSNVVGAGAGLKPASTRLRGVLVLKRNAKSVLKPDYRETAFEIDVPLEKPEFYKPKGEPS